MKGVFGQKESISVKGLRGMARLAKAIRMSTNAEVGHQWCGKMAAVSLLTS